MIRDYLSFYSFLIIVILFFCLNVYFVGLHHCCFNVIDVLGHSKYGIYVCKYADVCIRHASVRRTWEGNVAIKMIVFKVRRSEKGGKIRMFFFIDCGRKTNSSTCSKRTEVAAHCTDTSLYKSLFSNYTKRNR